MHQKSVTAPGRALCPPGLPRVLLSTGLLPHPSTDTKVISVDSDLFTFFPHLCIFNRLVFRALDVSYECLSVCVVGGIGGILKDALGVCCKSSLMFIRQTF